MKRWIGPIIVFILGMLFVAGGVVLAIDSEVAVRHEMQNRQFAKEAPENPGGISISIDHPTIGTPAQQQKLGIGLIVVGALVSAGAIPYAVVRARQK